jgi:hypothetical protein
MSYPEDMEFIHTLAQGALVLGPELITVTEPPWGGVRRLGSA